MVMVLRAWLVQTCHRGKIGCVEVGLGLFEGKFMVLVCFRPRMTILARFQRQVCGLMEI